MDHPHEPQHRPREPRHRSPSTESLLESDVLWRHDRGPAKDHPAAWEREPAPALRHRLARALTVPAVAGAALFVVAVIVAILVAVLQGRTTVAGPDAVGGDAAASEVSATEAPTRATAVGGAPRAAAGTAASGDSGGDDHDAGRVVVHVAGAVADPRLVELDAGSRVADAIEAAGGATAEAILASVNLARLVTDGEQIFVPDASSPALAEPAAGPAADPESGAGDGMVNLNSADEAALEALPRVGPALASRILEWREQHGGFERVEQLLEVSGIGAKTFEGLRELVVVR